MSDHYSYGPKGRVWSWVVRDPGPACSVVRMRMTARGRGLKLKLGRNVGELDLGQNRIPTWNHSNSFNSGKATVSLMGGERNEQSAGRIRYLGTESFR